jgi:hypothetical protein
MIGALLSSSVSDLRDAHIHFSYFASSQVYGLALLDILQTIMVTADAFHWFVYGFGNMAQLDQTFLNSYVASLYSFLFLQ